MASWLCRKEGLQATCRRPDFRPIPASLEWRASWSENLTNLASSLALYSHTSLTDALAMQASTARKFFEGKPFEEWKRGRESELKTQAAIVNRLNDVIRACGIVAKTVARSR